MFEKPHKYIHTIVCARTDDDKRYCFVEFLYSMEYANTSSCAHCLCTYAIVIPTHIIFCYCLILKFLFALNCAINMSVARKRLFHCNALTSYSTYIHNTIGTRIYTIKLICLFVMIFRYLFHIEADYIVTIWCLIHLFIFILFSKTSIRYNICNAQQKKNQTKNIHEYRPHVSN